MKIEKVNCPVCGKDYERCEHNFEDIVETIEHLTKVINEQKAEIDRLYIERDDPHKP